jgi:hypothetical protein
MIHFKSKKGMEASVLVIIIITLVAFFIIAGVIYRFMSKADEKEAEVLCHDSIAMRASTALQINTGSKASKENFHLIESTMKTAPVLCKTIDKKIKGSKDEVMKQIADKVARCWWMFGEGRYEEILHGSSITLAPSIFGMSNEQNKCFNCYNIMIDQDDIPGTAGAGIPINELLFYMWKHNYLQRSSHCKEGDECKECKINAECGDLECYKGRCDTLQGINYLDYIQSYGGPGMFINIAGGGTILPRHAYAISILPKVQEKEQTGWLKWIGIAGMGVAFLGGVACAVFTAGGCAPLAMSALTAIGSASGGVAARSLVVEVAEGHYRPEQQAPSGGAPAVTDQATQVSIETMFKERAYSSIYLSDTEYGQQFCGSGDLAGD